MRINPLAFDAFASVYDDTFTQSILGQFLRPRVWDKLGHYFTAGQHVLELACGTGEDAIWLAKRGVRVTATDGSAEMVRVARTKAETAGVAAWGNEKAEARRDKQAQGQGRVTIRQVSLQEITQGYFVEQPLGGVSKSGVEALVGPIGPNPAKVSTSEIVAGHPPPVTGPLFDGAYSNFGGLNTIGDWRPLAEALAKIIRPGGIVILVPMGPFCPWEIMWYLGHGQPKEAFRRFGRNASAKIGQSIIPIWYPSAQRLRADFSPWFQHRHTESLELWLPPSYLDHFVDKWPAFFKWLNRLEKATAHLSRGWGDHYIIIFERKSKMKSET